MPPPRPLLALDGLSRRAACRLLRWYQLLFGGLFWGRCRFSPTCSEYARLAFERRSFFVACGLTVWRLLRCHPFCAGGEDPPPPPRA